MDDQEKFAKASEKFIEIFETCRDFGMDSGETIVCLFISCFCVAIKLCPNDKEVNKMVVETKKEALRLLKKLKEREDEKS